MPDHQKNWLIRNIYGKEKAHWYRSLALAACRAADAPRFWETPCHERLSKWQSFVAWLASGRGWIFLYCSQRIVISRVTAICLFIGTVLA